MRKPRILVAAEISLQNPPVLSAIEHRAPRFEFTHAIGRFLGVQFRHAPLIHVLSAAHRIGEMHLPTVAIIDVGERSGDSAFGHNRVRFAEQTFANHPDRNASGRRLNGRAQSRATGADHQHVVFECFVVGHGYDGTLKELKSHKVTEGQFFCD